MYSVIHMLSNLFIYTEKKKNVENIYHSVNRFYYPMIFLKFSVCLYGNFTAPIMNVYCIDNKKKIIKLFLLKKKSI